MAEVPRPTRNTTIPDFPAGATEKLDLILKRQEEIEAMLKETHDAALEAVLKRDPLTWQRRAIILATSSFLGSTLGGAIVHTVWLAYFRR